MKKKTIVFLCLALLFLIAVPECFSSSLLTGIICIGLCALFAFLAYRSFVVPKTDTAAIDNSPNSFAPPEQSFVSDTPQHDTLSISAVEAPVAMPEINNQEPVQNDYEFLTVKVAGVTFKNDKGPTRQTILRKIRFNDKPFEEYVELGLRQYEFDGKPAYGVYANDMQIGNIPADYVQFVNDNIERLESICGIDVYGGGRDENGYAISYGCKITLKFRKHNFD